MKYEIKIPNWLLEDIQNYELSNAEFVRLKQLYPLSNEAIQAEIMIGFISYVKMDYESSIFQFE